MRCFFSEPIGSPLKNSNCVHKSTEIQESDMELGMVVLFIGSQKSNRKVYWLLNEKYLQQSIIIASQKWSVFCFLLWSKQKCKEPIPVRWYTFLIALIMNNMFLRRHVTSEGKKSPMLDLPELTALYLCLSSSLRCWEGQNYWVIWMNMRGNGPVLKSDTVCDLHMPNEAKI